MNERKKMNLKVYRLRPGAQLPHRAHREDAGMDLFYCPDPSSGSPSCIVKSDGSYIMGPGSSCLLPTGIKVEVPSGNMLEVKNKSGIAFKRQLVVGACVIDPGYDGEVFVNLHNIGTDTQVIEPGQKVAQAVLMPVVYCAVEEIENGAVMNVGSARSVGGFGSTGLR